MIHDKLLMVRGFTVDSLDISFMLHELYEIGGTHFILRVLSAIRGLYVYSCVILMQFVTYCFRRF